MPVQTVAVCDHCQRRQPLPAGKGAPAGWFMQAHVGDAVLCSTACLAAWWKRTGPAHDGPMIERAGAS